MQSAQADWKEQYEEGYNHSLTAQKSANAQALVVTQSAITVNAIVNAQNPTTQRRL